MTIKDKNHTLTGREDFSSTLTELIEFKDYFTDDKKINLLVDWLHEETKCSRFTARLTIKHIAPFILARLTSLGKIIGKAWTHKLHERLNKYNWYFSLSQTLLNILKTETDNSLQEALSIPSNDNLEALIKDKSRWESLKPEYQGLVQLLIGQNALIEDHTLQHKKIDEITRRLQFHLDLVPPEQIISQTHIPKDNIGNALWLTYAHRQVPFIDPQHALHQLDDFFEGKKTFSWWALTGPGGIGKSRLALEALIKQQDLWDVGFLSAVKLQIRDALSNWEPLLPTIIVIDYAAEYFKEVIHWIDHFIKHENDYDFPIRLLILERETDEQTWWKELVSNSKDALIRKKHLHKEKAYKLKPLPRTEQRSLLRHYLTSLQSNVELPKPTNISWKQLDALSNQGRPLFIGMAAIAIAEHGISHIRRWDNKDLLDYILDRETKIWKNQLREYSENQQEKVLDLLALTSMTSGLNWEKDEESISDNLITATKFAENDMEISSLWQNVAALAGHSGGYLQPDLLAEYFVLKRWALSNNQPNLIIKKLLNSAFSLYKRNTTAFIKRCAVDFPNNRNSSQWWLSFFNHRGNEANQDSLYELGFVIVSQLSLINEQKIALEHWIPKLLESNNEALKLKALTWQTLLYDNLGEHAKALESFQQALSIEQEIGSTSRIDITIKGESFAINETMEDILYDLIPSNPED